MVYSRAVAAIVTGGGTGIGAAIARRLAADGNAVAVMGRRSEPLQEVVSGLAEGMAVIGEAYRETWPPFFEWQKRGAVFEIVSFDVTRVTMSPSRPPCSVAGRKRSRGRIPTTASA